MVFNKLSDCFGSANVRSNQQIKDSQVDALVRINEFDRAIVEIKYLNDPSPITYRTQAVAKILASSVRSYKTLAPSHNTYGVALLILGHESYKDSEEKLIEFKPKTSRDVYIRIITIPESKFINLGCVELRSMFSASFDSKKGGNA